MTAGSTLVGQRVLVTGAAGFVGRHLVRRLTELGAVVLPLTRSQCDLTEPSEIRDTVGASAPHVVFHLAASRVAATAGERARTVAVNTLSGSRVVESVPDGCRVVIRLGSSTEYAASPTPMDENTPLRPRGFFGATKAAGSLLFSATAQERGIRSCVLRAFQVYGPGDHPGRFVPTLLRAARTGTPLPLTGPGLRRDWVWVGDVVDACLLAADRDDLADGSVLNVGTGRQTSNEEVVRLAEQATGRRISVASEAHPGRSWDTTDWVCDPAAAARELGWRAVVDLAEGLARCWAAG